MDRVKFSRALLTYRNTPDRDTRLSPAMALFGRQLRDFLPKAPLVGPMWRELADAREKALAPRSTKQHEKWSAGAKELPPLQVGDNVFIQNQSGNHPLKWDKRGKVVGVKGFDQYEVMVDGSRRITLRNRKYLRKYTPFKCQPFTARPVLINGTPMGTPQLQLRPQPRSDLGSEERAVEHHPVRVQHAERDGYVPQPAVLEDQAEDYRVGNEHVPPLVPIVPVVATPVSSDTVPYEPHAVGSPRREQVPRSRSPGMERRGSVEPDPSDIIEQEPINVNSEPNVRRSNRANKGQMPKALKDFEVELGEASAT